MSSSTRPVAPQMSLLKPSNAIFLPVAFAAAYLSYVFLWTIWNAYLGPLSKYPGPRLRSLTILPKVWSIYSGNEGSDYVALHEKYGPIVRIAPRELSFVGNAQTFRDIYGFKKSGERGPFKDPVMIPRPITGVHSMLTADDEQHSRQRRIVANAFADRSLKDLEPMLKQWVAKMVQKLGESASAGGKTDMLKYYNCTTFVSARISKNCFRVLIRMCQDIMADLCFNESLNMLEDSEYSPWVKTIFAGIRASSPFRAVRCLGRPAGRIIDSLVLRSKRIRQTTFKHLKYSSDRVDKRLAMKGPPPRADLWTKIIEKSNASDEGFTLAEHHTTAMVFMAAGTETSATALSGITYHLLRNPAMMARITAEVRNFAATAGKNFDLDDLRRLPYLQAVISEGLRMYPPVPIALQRRTPPEGSTIAGDYIPGDVGVAVHQLATYRHESNFAKPYEFHPERWLPISAEEGNEVFKDDHRAALEPFSVGPRNCIGKNLAYHEIRLILTETLRNFDLALCSESANWTEQKVYLLWEKHPLWCKLTPVQTAA